MENTKSVEELDQQIAKVSRSTRASFGIGARMHNYLRMKYAWYYRWHMNPASNTVHVAGAIAIGFIFTFLFIAMIGGISVYGLLQWINYFIEVS